MAAGARRRQLPAWMAAAEDGRGAAAAPSPGAGRRRAAAGRRPAALYCMNEAELLEVALAVLAENLQCEEGEENARSRSEEELELPPAPNEVPGSTASTDGGSDHGPALPSPPGAGAGTERTGGDNSEYDVLKYVREIFFS